MLRMSLNPASSTAEISKSLRSLAGRVPLAAFGT
jgi:hypothetical protein